MASLPALGLGLFLGASGLGTFGKKGKKKPGAAPAPTSASPAPAAEPLVEDPAVIGDGRSPAAEALKRLRKRSNVVSPYKAIQPRSMFKAY